MEDVLNALNKYITDENRVIALFGPDTVEEYMPTAEDILALLYEIRNTELDMYPDKACDLPLMASTPRRVRIRPRNITYNSLLNMHTWTLPNGARVHLKQTDFRNNEVLIRAFRSGGLSQADDDILASAMFSPSIIEQSGFGHFDGQRLERYLSTRDVRLSSQFTRDREQITGRSSTGDIRTAMQLIWLNFNHLNFDEDAFDRLVRQTEIWARNTLNVPRAVFNKGVRNATFEDMSRLKDPRGNVDDLMEVNHRDAFEFYRSRFSSATGFDFVFVGDISKEVLHELIETYIATLPGDTRRNRTDTSIIDRNIRFSQESTTKHIYMGNEQTMVNIIFPTPFIDCLYERRMYSAATRLLSNMLFESVREGISGVYSIFAFASTNRYPYAEANISIQLSCDYERLEEIETEIIATIQMIKDDAFEDRLLTQFKETDRQQRENSRITNAFWADTIITNVLFWEDDAHDLLTAGEFVQNITREDMVLTITRYIDFGRMKRVILMPEHVEIQGHRF
jgi:zinc protease